MQKNEIEGPSLLSCPPEVLRQIASGEPIDDLVFYWGIFVTSFVGIFLFREKMLP